MLRSLLILLCSLLAASFANGYSVTFRLNMNGIGGFQTPELNGTFNNWCGNCNVMNDDDGDGIWEVTLSLSAGTYEYKYSFDNWTGQENLSASTQCVITNGNFTNRKFTVQADTILPVACWGLCSNCISAEPANWTLIWSDEFSGNTLDTDIWTPETGAGGWGNNELQYYTANPQNLTVDNGSLKINALEETIGSSNYTSSRIITKDLFEFQYGKIEARIKVPLGQGIWPAFWMLGANFSEVGWPQCGEIDVMEHINNESLTNGTVHWYNNNNHAYKGSSVPIDETQFHFYGAIWDASRIQFYVDEFVYYEFDYASYTNSASIFQKPFFLLLNVAVGGNWPGYPDASTTFPVTMEVDYVRLYQQPAVGVQATTAVSPLSIYPNPFSNELSVAVDSRANDLQFTVHTATGALIASGKMNDPVKTFNTQHWPHGVYYLHVFSESEDYTVVQLVK